MKNILITGGAGFMGSHLIEELIKNKENNIICIDNFITSDYYNIEPFVREQNFEFLKYDLVEPIALNTIADLNKFRLHVYGIEQIYHLACPTSPKDYDTLPLQTCLANSHATRNALEIARRYKSKFLFVSSSAIYGTVRVQDQPVKETHTCTLESLGPRSCYSDGKRFAENLTVYYGAEYNFETKIARVFNTYGPKMRMNDGRIIPDFVSQALKNEPIVIHGNEEIANSFCYVKDMTDALIKLMESPQHDPINIGAEQLYTLDDVASAVITITDSSSAITHSDPLQYRDPEPLPDISLAKDKLGWIPITPLEDGLVATVSAMRAQQIMKFKPT